MATETSNSTPFQTALKYGGIVSLILIILGLIFQLTGIADPTDQQNAGNMASNCISTIILIVGVVMAIQHHKKKVLGGYISFGKCVAVGTLTALVIGVISGIWMVVYMGLIDPEMMDIIRENALEEAAKNTPEEGMETAEKIIDFTTGIPFLAGVVFFINTFVGFITSLITGAVVKEENPVA